jgi:hypothetical protein
MGGLEMKLKNIILSMFLIIALAFTSISANADLALDETVFGSTNPTFGSASQEASNPLHDDGPKVVKTQGQITIKNIDPNLELIITSASFQSDETYNLLNDDVKPVTVFTGGVFKLGPNTPSISGDEPSSKAITFEAKIPEDLDAIDINGDVSAFKIGTITINAQLTNGTIITPLAIPVFMQRENNLEITDSDAEINNKGKESIDDGDEIKDIKPGDVIEILVEVESKFDDQTEVDIENVDLILDCSTNDALDIDDENLDIGDISPEDTESDTFNINVEDDAEDGDVGCTILARGVDQNGALMGQSLDFDINVERESHDIQIQLPVTTLPQAITCDDSSLQMTVNFINLGKSDEDEVTVEVTSADLVYQERRSNIELDEDDSETEIFDVPLTKLTGKTPITFTIRTFYDNVKSSDTETLLVENTCTSATPSNNDDNQGSSTPKPVVGKGTIILEEGVITTTVNKFNSVAVQVTNNDKMPIDFEVSLSDITDFATASSPKVVRLSPGQTSTIFLNFKTKPEIEAGTYTGTVTLKSGGQLVETQLFNVETTGDGEDKSTSTGGIDTTKLFWIIGDIILVIVAIFFIRLIFTGGKRKDEKKKMADYEAQVKRKR